MKPGSPEFDKLIQELATRGFFVQMGADKDDLRKMGLSYNNFMLETYGSKGLKFTCVCNTCLQQAEGS